MASKMVLLFYKGTSLPYDTEFYDKVLPNVSEMIQNGLKEGLSRKTQIQDYIEQLDFLEQSIVNCKTQYTTRDIQIHWGDQWKEYFTVWILNILALLELGVLKNDNMNGTMFLGGDLPLFENKCLWCEKPNPKEHCPCHKEIRYCNEECQKMGWKSHKTLHKKKCSKKQVKNNY